MPMFEWKEEDMKYAMCFFPAIGMVIGAVFYGMFLLLSWLLPGSFLAAGILLAVPIFITGGIHMDGFMDTCDARASYGDREKKLAILKDTHTGAFAVIFGALYLILYAAACMELDRETQVAGKRITVSAKAKTTIYSVFPLLASAIALTHPFLDGAFLAISLFPEYHPDALILFQSVKLASIKPKNPLLFCLRNF